MIMDMNGIDLKKKRNGNCALHTLCRFFKGEILLADASFITKFCYHLKLADKF